MLSYKEKKGLKAILSGTGAGGRTRTGMVSRRILSAVRLPIPPHRRILGAFTSNNNQYIAF